MCDFDRNILGCVIRLQTISGEYEGTAKAICDDTGKLVLDKVTALPQETKLKGLQNFFRHEITSYNVLKREVVVPEKEKARLSDEIGKKLIRNLRPLPFSHRSVRDETDEYGETEEEPEEPFLKEGPIQWECSETKIPPNFRFQLPNTFVFIDSIDDTFRNAVASVKGHAIIGVSMEGAPLGRDGEPCWLLVSTKDFVYFFDLLALKNSTFEEGLKDILECSYIMKVFHNCRLPSDTLFHKYGVSLENVFDTQAADIVNRFRMYTNGPPEYARSVSNSVEYYLHLDRNFVSHPKIRMACFEKDLCEWKRRPLSSSYRNAAIRKVIYLRELRVAILEKLLSDVNDVTTHFLNVVRDASAEEVSKLNLGATHVIPPGINLTSNQTRNRFPTRPQNGRKGGRPQKLVEKDIDNIFDVNILDYFNQRRSLPTELATNRSNTEIARLRSIAAHKSDAVNGHCKLMQISKPQDEKAPNNAISTSGFASCSESESSISDVSLEDKPFSWPVVSEVRNSVRNCVPAGRLA